MDLRHVVGAGMGRLGLWCEGMGSGRRDSSRICRKCAMAFFLLELDWSFPAAESFVERGIGGLCGSTHDTIRSSTH